MKNTRIVVNSPEVEEILSKIPSWITRWGITVVLSVILILLLLSNIITLPDLLRTKAIVCLEDKDKFSLRIPVYQALIAEIHPGSIFVLKFDNYPFMKYGIYSDTIRDKITTRMQNDTFYINVNVPAKIKTNMKKDIVAVDGLTADCEIAISETSVFKKFINSIKN
jgi:hypothetical protein